MITKPYKFDTQTEKVSLKKLANVVKRFIHTLNIV